jgi:HSP20 family protein
MASATTFEHRVSRLLSDVFGDVDWEYRDGTGAAWIPPAHISAQPDGIQIAVEVPGVNPTDLKISLENNVLAIQGTKLQTAFERRFTVPPTIDTTAIKATYEHGVLTVTLPKVEQARPRQIEVQVNAK